MLVNSYNCSFQTVTSIISQLLQSYFISYKRVESDSNFFILLVLGITYPSYIGPFILNDYTHSYSQF